MNVMAKKEIEIGITMGMGLMAKKEIEVGITMGMGLMAKKEIGTTMIARSVACSWSTTLMECSIKVSRASRGTTASVHR